MTVAQLRRLGKLAARIPEPRLDLRQLSAAELFKLQGHLLAAVIEAQASGVAPPLDGFMTNLVSAAMEEHRNLPRRLEDSEYQRLIRGPTKHPKSSMATRRAAGHHTVPRWAERASRGKSTVEQRGRANGIVIIGRNGRR